MQDEHTPIFGHLMTLHPQQILKSAFNRIFLNYRAALVSLFIFFCLCLFPLKAEEKKQIAPPKTTRDVVKIVGSGTVLPFSKAVTEAFAKRYHVPIPEIAVSGSGTGFKNFCKGTGLGFPDITNASRPMKLKEWKLCQKNKINNISEIKFGNDGLAMLALKKAKTINDLSIAQLYKAIAQFVEVDGKMVENPYFYWNEISPSLPNQPIIIYGPRKTAGTYGILVKLIIKKTCNKKVAYFKTLREKLSQLDYKKELKKYCGKPRSDTAFRGVFLSKANAKKFLQATPNGFFFIGYNTLFKNRDFFRSVAINGVEPRVYTISDGSYKLARPLFFYIKNAHRKISPNLDGFVKEFMSRHAMGTFGYLMELGLGSLSNNDLKDAQYAVAIGRKMRRYNK